MGGSNDDMMALTWRSTTLGNAAVKEENNHIVLETAPTQPDVYSDAQISDYAGANFRWRPPLCMTVTARASSQNLRGTAGFGFWNQPFMPGQMRLRLPQAIWFFYSSPPSDMRLAQDVPGPGWKAATINAKRWQFLMLLPTAPVGVLLMRVPALYQRLWPIGQRAIGVSETLLDSALLTETHTYTLDWRKDGATFRVDDRVVHQAPYAPGGPLGFVAWVDNQYAVVTPQGHFRFGLLPLLQPQTMVIKEVKIEPYG